MSGVAGSSGEFQTTGEFYTRNLERIVDFDSGRLIRRIVNDFPLYPANFYAVDRGRIEEEARSVVWIVDAQPFFNAYAQPGANQIGINLFTILSILALPRLSKYLDDVLHGDSLPIDQAIHFSSHPTAEVLAEVDGLFATWSRIHWQLQQHAGWVLAEFPRDPGLSYYVGMLRFILFHEIGHWNYERFTPAAQQLLHDRTVEHMRDYLPHFAEINGDAAATWIAEYLGDDCRRAKWLKEVTADSMAAFACEMFCSTQQQQRDWYASLAISFGIMKYYEFYVSRLGEISYEAHPPTVFREGVLYHILSREKNISPRQFLTDEFGAGVIAGELMSNVLSAYVHGRPG